MPIVVRRWIKVAAPAALFLLSLDCGHRPPPGEELQGNYQYRHRVFVFHGSEPTEIEVVDQLTIRGSDDQLSIDLLLHRVSGETCVAKGPIDWRGDAYVYTVGDGVKRSECVLRLMPVSSAVMLKSSGAGCKKACNGVDVLLNPATSVLSNIAD